MSAARNILQGFLRGAQRAPFNVVQALALNREHKRRHAENLQRMIFGARSPDVARRLAAEAQQGGNSLLSDIATRRATSLEAAARTQAEDVRSDRYWQMVSRLPEGIRSLFLKGAPDQGVAQAATTFSDTQTARAEQDAPQETEATQAKNTQQDFENNMARIRLLPDARLKLNALAENGFIESSDAQAAIGRLEAAEKQKQQEGYQDPSGVRAERLFDLTLQILQSGRGEVSADRAAQQAIAQVKNLEAAAQPAPASVPDPAERLSGVLEILRGMDPAEAARQIEASQMLSEKERAWLKQALGFQPAEAQ